MTTKPITIEKQQPGLWHVAHIDSEGRLITRTTVMPNDANEPTELNGAVGDTDQIAWELGRAVRRLSERNPESESVHRYRTMLRNIREWHDQFPNQERAVVDEQLPIVIYGDGVIRSPGEADTSDRRMPHVQNRPDFRLPDTRQRNAQHLPRLAAHRTPRCTTRERRSGTGPSARPGIAHEPESSIRTPGTSSSCAGGRPHMSAS